LVTRLAFARVFFEMDIAALVVPRKKRGKDMVEVQCGGVVTSHSLGVSISKIAKLYKKSRSAVVLPRPRGGSNPRLSHINIYRLLS
jgi:hypothetical protein